MLLNFPTGRNRHLGRKHRKYMDNFNDTLHRHYLSFAMDFCQRHGPVVFPLVREDVLQSGQTQKRATVCPRNSAPIKSVTDLLHLILHRLSLN